MEEQIAAAELRRLPALARRPSVVTTLEQVYDHNFFDEEVAYEAGRASRALLHAGLNGLDGQVVALEKKVNELRTLDKTEQSISIAQQNGYKNVHYFGKMSPKMQERLGKGQAFSFQSDEWYWQFVSAGTERNTMIPLAALERLSHLKMHGFPVSEMLMGKAVAYNDPTLGRVMLDEIKSASNHVRDTARTFHVPDPVLVVTVEQNSPWLIEIYRWNG